MVCPGDVSDVVVRCLRSNDFIPTAECCELESVSIVDCSLGVTACLAGIPCLNPECSFECSAVSILGSDGKCYVSMSVSLCSEY